ncbi:hypothetical protein NLU13_6308 [Sarocladium strictum]|uniref:RNase III domain-containing protein n=1 Tax=Sarocladium strictum TaxID=5046 RepID=A0AA39GGY3_SARSR|nr:hypothetical protein NLU13_6308 [Sarocladium strictum]
MATKRANDDGEIPDAKRQQLDGFYPNVLNLTAWSRSDLPASTAAAAAATTLPPLPPLPKPADPRLEEQAFNHISLNNNENYEELEWLGDSWVELIATKLIYETFRGKLKTGRLSQLRERLVCNRTLASFLRAYGLDSRIKIQSEILNPAQEAKANDRRRTKDALTTVQKIHGDVFEAYVGAIIESDRENGDRIAADWLKKLWSRELQDEIRTYAGNRDSQITAAHADSSNPSAATPTPTSSTSALAPAPTTNVPKSSALSPKVLLSQAIACPGVVVDYRDMPGKPKKDEMGHNLFAVGVYFSGWGVKDELLAVGRALKKSEAGAKAAEEALRNKKVLKTYGDKKQAFLKARDAVAASERT